MTNPDKTNRTSWYACHACNVSMGGVVPKDERAVTAMRAACPYCGFVAMLVPHCDYDWPAEGKAAVWD